MLISGGMGGLFTCLDVSVTQSKLSGCWSKLEATQINLFFSDSSVTHFLLPDGWDGLLLLGGPRCPNVFCLESVFSCIIRQLRKYFPSLLLHHDFLPHLLTTKNASNQKMSENRPSLNMLTDSKTAFEIFKTQKSN